MDQNIFISFIGQLKNHLPVKIWMHMKHCCTPKTTVSSIVSNKTLVLGYHLHRETQYFHLHRETIFPLREIPEALF